MAIDRRAPGDTSLHTRSRVVSWQYWNPNLSGGQSTQTEFKSIRPVYPYGSVITLPGGTRFRKSTSYSHQTFEIGQFTPYECKGYYSVYNYFYASVDAREIGTIIDLSGALIDQMSSSMRNECVTKSLNNLADQKVNLGENLATLGQTIRLLHDSSKLLLDALKLGLDNKRLRSYLLRSPRQLIADGLEKTAKHYLEYVYGLKPLVQDVYSLVMLAKSQGVKDLLLHSHGSSKRTTYFGSDNWSGHSYSYTRRLTATVNEKANCHLWATIDPNYSGLRSLNQLGLLNPLGVAWDVVPWSFVVDWFLPIGPVLYALTAPAGLNFVDGSIGWKSSQASQHGYKSKYPVSAGLRFTYEKPCVIPLTVETYRREHLTSWPLPGLWFDPDPLRGDRPLKALALAIIAFRKTRLNVR